MSQIDEVIAKVKEKDKDQPEFIQAVTEVLTTLKPTEEKHPEFVKAKIYERIVEPDRIIQFRIAWMDDNHNVHVNRGYRVQFNNAIGPYKGGLRFHPSVNVGVIKFLGFEQTFKNSLTTLPMGGGKGGSDFDPRGRSDAEIMRFCQAFMTELFRHIGPDTDVPAGDIGVGIKEIGYLFGQYKKIVNEFTGVLTGKGLTWGGSLIRPEATGFGVVYFTEEVLKTKGMSIEGKTVAISGFGNVAWGVVQKVAELGGKVVTLSGPDGFIYDPDGVKGEKIEYMRVMRASGRDRVQDYADKFKVKFEPNKRPWSVPVDVAIPCATQNELDIEDAKQLVKNGVKCVVEAANMPCTLDAMKYFQENKILFGPAKAANAGGVAVSGLEMTQNSMRLSWSREEVDAKLREIMIKIHNTCLETAEAYGKPGDYVTGANIAGFLKVADAMLAQGVL
ncbi:MAG TPA: NADP-specific glutamate dehydrogenase [Candidatus Hydrothermia bacterium]|nr:NADP-specific glutamate dehydrogenase [Candidatus Hydrothermae bacterium]MDD3648494.1 NADP-specific glutamate dehydrogenase [Candidatus Hydrothermia bacterium]MDD5573055.1 NADP-specific glutamate dehydrogenase [Candidatus Hydrothermia bacterium]HOK23672.1 NADP-specific glutamate dehydrogenase [Candidatus Hydrothermia bacterium]HOL24313.1 NADP-specific glutamate dehydrogenase [Candidatus Hydrothermia bacterium]